MAPVKTVLRNVFFGSLERITREPACGTKTEICRTEPIMDIRKIAPYILQVHRGKEEVYIRYAAAIGIKNCKQENNKLSNAGLMTKLNDQFICLVFDIYLDYLVAYAGYFVVDKLALLTPEGGRVESVLITPLEDVSTQLGMALMINGKLKSFDEYFACDAEQDLMSLATSFTRIMDQEVISFWNGIRNLRPVSGASNRIDQSSANQEDGNETDTLSEVPLVQVYPSSKTPFMDNWELTLSDADTVSFEDFIFDDQTVICTVQDLKNRKRILFHQEQVKIETSDKWIDNIVDSYQMLKSSRFDLVSEDECRDLVFCRTKYYAGIATGSSGEIAFYKRVFLIGQCLDKFLVIPYNNTDNREMMTLQSAFGTDILYQRFSGNYPDERDVPTLVDSVDVDEIHIPDFVGINDAFHILKYWKTCTSKEEQVITHLIMRLQTKPESPFLFQSDIDQDCVSPLDQKRKIDWSFASSTPKKSRIDFDERRNCYNGGESLLGYPSTEPQLIDPDSIRLSPEFNVVEGEEHRQESDEGEDLVKDYLKESTTTNLVNHKEWECIIDPTTRRIHQINLTVNTTEAQKLINDFVPYKQIHTYLRDFMTDKWETAYLGLTDYFAECPMSSCKERNLFLNVLVLGCLQEVFIILPVKVNLLTTRMKIGLPCAVHNLYTRRNRDWFMRRLKRQHVDFSIPTSYNIPAKQLAQALKYKHLVTTGASSFQKAIFNRCTSC